MSSTSSAGGAGGGPGASGGSAGEAGATGNPANGGTGGESTSDGTGCEINVDSYEVSSAIETVGIVTWSSPHQIDRAQIRFGLVETGPTLTAPVDLQAPNFRTLLLGMKEARDYTFLVAATSNGRRCASATYTLTTGFAPNTVPRLSRRVVQEARIARGFMLLSAGIGSLGGGMSQARGGAPAFIIDHEGDVVWWSPEPAPPQTSRARMDWEGQQLWMMSLNVQGGGGRMDSVSMDGLTGQKNVSGLNNGHHDFTVVPGGGVVAIVHQNGCSGIVERHPDGSVEDIVSDVSSLYQPVADCHPNSILYQHESETFTLSDRNPNLFVRFSRSGEIVWQFGGEDPKPGALHFPGTWQVNHGHHLLDNGHFLFFNNGAGRSSSPVYEYTLDEGTGQATQIWTYISDLNSGTLGDVQRLPNGNTLVTYSNAGVIQEVDAAGELVQQFSTDSLGYATHRPTLYGPPPR